MKPPYPKPYGAPKFERPNRRPEDGPPSYAPRQDRSDDTRDYPPRRPYQERSEGYQDRPYQPRPYGGRDEGSQERPYQQRSYGDRPYQQRSYGDRPYQDRPRPFRPRPEWRDDRPRPESGYREARPAAAATPAPAAPARDPQFEQRLQRVKLFLCDVDGVLTDAGVFMGQGEETKRFNIRDGFGLRLLQRQGVKVGWVSHRASVATAKRAEDLKIDFLHQEPGSKVAAIEAILTQTGLTWEDVCFMGDDIVDLGALKRAGLAVTVGQGITEVKAIAHYVTKAAAGHGAVREIAEMILKAQDKWAPLVAEYSA